MGEGKAYTAGVAQRRMDEERMPYRSENTTYNSQVPVGRVYISSPFGVMDVNASHMELACIQLPMCIFEAYCKRESEDGVPA